MSLSFQYLSKFTLRQILLASIGFIAGCNSGGIFAFTSILFEQLKQDQATVLNVDDKSWLASIVIVIMVPSSLLSGVLSEAIGRRLLAIIIELLALSCWIITYLASNYYMLMAARSLFGIFIGMVYPIFIMYIGEVASPRYRTFLLSAGTAGSTFGAFICQFLGEYLSWEKVAIIFCFLPVCNIIILLYIKDSYVTYLNRNNFEAAQTSFEWFRGTRAAAKKEFSDLLKENKKTKNTLMELVYLCSKKSFLVPLSISTLVFLTNEVTGTQAVIFYTSQIISLIKDDAEFSYYATLTLNILRIIAVILCVLMMKLFSVRFILLTTGYLLGLSLVSLGLFMYLSLTFRDNALYPILSFMFLVLNTVLYGIGLGPLPSVVCGEMFPQETRSIGASISAALSFFFLFMVVKFMPLMLSEIGPVYTFGFFGVLTLAGIVISHYFLPNTKNKTLKEINRLYQDESM